MFPKLNVSEVWCLNGGNIEPLEQRTLGTKNSGNKEPKKHLVQYSLATIAIQKRETSTPGNSDPQEQEVDRQEI